MSFVVLGGTGSMGRVVVKDLVESGCKVKIVGRDEAKVNAAVESYESPKVTGEAADVSDLRNLSKAFEESDVVINCVQYELNLQVMKACLQAAVNYTDLGGLFHMTRRQLKMHEDFRKENLLALLGMGAAPGITNLLAEKAVESLDSCESIRVMVGGRDFSKPEGNAPPLSIFYSIQTILEEHNRKPMVFSKGKFSEVMPRSGREVFDFPNPIGKVTGICTLHSEVATLPLSFAGKGVKECSFKIAFPGDFEEKISFLSELGLGSPEAVDYKGQKIVPLEYLAFMLNKLPRLSQCPDDVELIRVVCQGKKKGKRKVATADCWAFSIKEWCLGAGDVDTGVPPSIAAQMIANGMIKAKGVVPPEKNVPLDHFFKELSKRKMKVKVS